MKTTDSVYNKMRPSRLLETVMRPREFKGMPPYDEALNVSAEVYVRCHIPALRRFEPYQQIFNV